MNKTKFLNVMAITSFCIATQVTGCSVPPEQANSRDDMFFELNSSHQYRELRTTIIFSNKDPENCYFIVFLKATEKGEVPVSFTILQPRLRGQKSPFRQKVLLPLAPLNVKFYGFKNNEQRVVKVGETTLNPESFWISSMAIANAACAKIFYRPGGTVKIGLRQNI